jgi:hypothetical protein
MELLLNQINVFLVTQERGKIYETGGKGRKRICWRVLHRFACKFSLIKIAMENRSNKKMKLEPKWLSFETEVNDGNSNFMDVCFKVLYLLKNFWSACQ